MKPFFSAGGVSSPRHPSAMADGSVATSSNDAVQTAFRARLAAYDSLAAAPRVYDVVAADPSDLIEQVAARAYTLAHEAGGTIPYTVIREIVENLIHADFREPVVSILGNGTELRFSDQGPGIPDKERALMPGYTTATHDMKRFIRGVGSGLPLVREFLKHSGGSLEVTDNLARGTMVTLRVGRDAEPSTGSASESASQDGAEEAEQIPDLRLTTRHKRVLSLILEYGNAGPTLVSRELAVGLSTAHRDLAFLEDRGLIDSDDTGKRKLTALGERYVNALFL